MIHSLKRIQSNENYFTGVTLNQFYAIFLNKSRRSRTAVRSTKAFNYSFKGTLDKDEMNEREC